MIGTARRATRDRARAEMMTGGTVLVSTCGRDSFPVGPSAVTHKSTDPDAWVRLAATVDRYADPRQAFYVLEEETPAAPTVHYTPRGVTGVCGTYVPAGATLHAVTTDPAAVTCVWCRELVR